MVAWCLVTRRYGNDKMVPKIRVFRLMPELILCHAICGVKKKQGINFYILN